MKVVLFCGGFGTRLKEYSETIPKPMVEIGYRPIMWHIMRYYAHFGHKEFILCLGYKMEVIKEWVLNYRLMDNDFTMHLGPEAHTVLHGDNSGESWQITCAASSATTSFFHSGSSLRPPFSRAWAA